MITPDEVREKAARRYPDYLRAWLRQMPFFPLEIPFRKPLPSDGYLTLREGIQALVAGSKDSLGYGYRIEFATRQTRRLGEQSLPQRIVIETEADFARLLGKEAEIAQFQRDVALIRAELPALEDWLADHPQTVIEHAGEWPDLVQVCRYFVAHPRPNLYLRELPIPVHTKFVEGHKGILRRLLDTLLPDEAICADATMFERRYGLRYDEPLIRVRILDPRLQEAYRLLMDDFSTPVSQFERLALVGRCVITENKMNFLTLPRLENTFAVFGGGFNVEHLKSVRWLAQCPLIYWGDLDAHGLVILSQLRASFPRVQSVMMDEATLAAFEAFVVPGEPCAIHWLPNLTPEEHALFEGLARDNRRLEQEKISYAYAVEQLHNAVQH